MPRGRSSPDAASTRSIDPIAFDDQTIFGLDPAVHWLRWKGQREQFPQIILEIANHWDERVWLERLVERIGYNAGVYEASSNPKGIFAEPFSFRTMKGQAPGIPGLRYFALRAAGVKTELCASMFALNVAPSTSPPRPTKKCKNGAAHLQLRNNSAGYIPSLAPVFLSHARCARRVSALPSLA